MKKSVIYSILIGLLLICTIPNWGVALAQDPGTPSTKAASGKVTKLDDTSLTIDSKGPSGDKSESITFILNDDTQKPSNLAVGLEVTVQYKEQANNKVATIITVKPAPVKP